MSYQASSGRGREESAAVTRGRRKVIAERIDRGEPGPNPDYGPAYLIGACGHTLRWLAATRLDSAAPHYLTGKLGRRMTCPHDDCRIPPKQEN